MAVATDAGGNGLFHACDTDIPPTMYQSVMETAAHDTPVLSLEERQAHPQRALAALNLLDELDQQIVVYRVFEKLSLRNIAERIKAPNHVWVLRRWENAVAELREVLGDHDAGMSWEWTDPETDPNLVALGDPEHVNEPKEEE